MRPAYDLAIRDEQRPMQNKSECPPCTSQLLIDQIKTKKARMVQAGYVYDPSPRMSVIIQSFNHVGNIDTLIGRLRNTDAEEIIVSEDGSIDGSHERWMSHLTRPNDILIHTNDLHEIRASDRAISLARGNVFCLIQDDDILPEDGQWIETALALFDAHPRLGVLGGFMGWNDFFDSYYINDQARRNERPLPHVDPSTGQPFLFVENVNIGPYFARKEYFTEVGGWDFRFSDSGKPGMGFDHELCYRMWLAGYEVGYYQPVGFLANSQLVTGGTYLWGQDDRKTAEAFYQTYIRKKYATQHPYIKGLVKRANEQLINK